MSQRDQGSRYTTCRPRLAAYRQGWMYRKAAGSALPAWAFIMAAILGSTPVFPAAGSEQSPETSTLAQVRTLRDQKQFQAALQALDSLAVPDHFNRDTRLIKAMLLAETGRAAPAFNIVADVLKTDPDAVDANLAAAYVYRLTGNATAALAASQRVLQQQPGNAEAYQHQVFALNDVGSPARALALAEAMPTLFPESQLIYLRAQRAAQQIRWGEITTSEPSQRFDATDRALQMLDGIEQQLPASAQEDWLRNQRDRVLALRQREQMTAAIELFETLEEVDEAIPPYTLEAAADAYLYARQPRRAADLYYRILEADPWNYNTREALYWALIESEQFRKAITHIDQLAAEQPMFRTGSPFWQRLYLDTTAAMARAMANQPATAQQQLNTLLVDAPASALIRRELATVYRWRGWPNLAMEEMEIALAYEPEVMEGQLLYATLLLDLGQYQQAGEWIETLYEEYPTDLHVQQQYAAWQDRRRWGIRSDAEYGDSNGFREYGSQSWRIQTRLDAPWLGHHFRPYATHYYASARFPEGRGRYDLIGLGIDWQRQRHHLYAEANRGRANATQSGFTLGYDAELGDHWSLSARHENFSNLVPLRAYHHGLEGNRSEVAARWRAHESFNARLGLSQLSISDGNVRQSALFLAEHRLFASAHHITTGSMELYGSHASREGGPYFNPKRDASAMLTLSHDWLTWRHYERSFTQRFGFAAGRYWQEGFGSAAIGDLRYEHEWHLTRTWRLRYGINLSSRVYDGIRERRLSGQLGLEVLLW